MVLHHIDRTFPEPENTSATINSRNEQSDVLDARGRCVAAAERRQASSGKGKSLATNQSVSAIPLALPSSTATNALGPVAVKRQSTDSTSSSILDGPPKRHRNLSTQTTALSASPTGLGMRLYARPAASSSLPASNPYLPAVSPLQFPSELVQRWKITPFAYIQSRLPAYRLSSEVPDSTNVALYVLSLRPWKMTASGKLASPLPHPHDQ
ncbi:hypothetical protein P7C70_g1615, partial [Phenoliferia sp. Uapishka_3]